MNFDAWLASAGLGWREAVVGLIALLGLYILIVMLRLKRLGRRKGEEGAKVPPAAPQLDTTDAEAGDEHPEPIYARPEEKPSFAWNEPPAAKVFAEEQYFKAVEVELGQLREEVAVLRHEFAKLREEMRGQVGQIKASQNMSPLYSDAMQMAMLGHDAETIAERCGIARAEADLVVALARNQGE
ncbi:hypothetical protein AZSI13_19480 [Azospira sp. I13]|uniref:DUF2802 domain-containing protein n=1 Tax=Azospira sp. I13 TaxID=1765050 RepID=UPI000D3F00D9|nr:DUF2802 domain-containing protein [Azospira sp. I13]GBG02621.1 hypothetical protein AZSI13_19480 [Azospira sp. I13]